MELNWVYNIELNRILNTGGWMKMETEIVYAESRAESENSFIITIMHIVMELSGYGLHFWDPTRHWLFYGTDESSLTSIYGVCTGTGQEQSSVS